MTEFLAFLGRHPLLTAAFVTVLVAWLLYEISQARTGYRVLGPAAATMLVNRENAVMVDVNPPADFEKGHIAGARNLPFSQFDPAGKELQKLKGQPLVLACRDGMTSKQACARLVKAGFERVHLLRGGLGGWVAEQLPLARGRG